MKTMLALSIMIPTLFFGLSARSGTLDCSETGISKQMEMVNMMPCFQSDSILWEVRKATNYLGECIAKASLKETNDFLLPALTAASAKYKCIKRNDSNDSGQPTDTQSSDERLPVRR